MLLLCGLAIAIGAHARELCTLLENTLGGVMTWPVLALVGAVGGAALLGKDDRSFSRSSAYLAGALVCALLLAGLAWAVTAFA